MSRRTIEKNLKKALLQDGSLEQALYEFELEEHVAEYLQSKREDGDKYFFAVTEHTNEVALLLIDENDHLHINEAARAVLKQLWADAYEYNIKKLIPNMAEQLEAGYLFSAGVKEVAGVFGRGLRR
ncbi:MAG: hypothetical protein U0401_18880 [Anaerolineae bacterium]